MIILLHFNVSLLRQTFKYSVFAVSRLAGVDQAIHKLNVGHYTLDVKVSQLIDRLSRLDGKIQNADDRHSNNTPEGFIHPIFFDDGLPSYNS